MSARKWAALVWIFVAYAGSCRSAEPGLTGTVYDAATKQPLQGVTVVAPYGHVNLGIAGSAFVCDDVRWAVTGKDGRFHFPPGKSGGPYLADPGAFLADHYLKEQRYIDRRSAEPYSGRDIYLAVQQPGNPDLRDLTASRLCPQSDFHNVETSKWWTAFQATLKAESTRLQPEMEAFAARVKTVSRSPGCYAIDKLDRLQCCIGIPDESAFRDAQARIREAGFPFESKQLARQICVRKADFVAADQFAENALYP